ncbi:MAG: alpha/beta fold hydrolase [Cyclobacteriaceae bacterium]|jgi:pimeloyl-ACP methyl ester carboxylesterase|nr:alpha/beta fold hydrolase [Cyclobacteriaceae bacterium]
MKLFYREYGEGQPFIILHGLMGSSDNWLPQAKMFSEHYHVFVVDQRNHGQSPHSEEFNYEVLATDLLEFIQEHELKNPVLLGHSMGGKAVMNFALQNPDLPDALIVVDIAPKAYEVRHDYIVEGLKAVPIESIQNRNEADESLSRHVADPAVRQFLLKNLMRKPEGGFGWRINLPVIDRSIHAIGSGLFAEGKFTKKTLFIRGLKSDYILDEDRALIHNYFSASTLVDMHTGHWVQAEKPAEFVDVVLNFLKSGS